MAHEPIAFIPVTSELICKTAQVASDIWHEYWPALIGREQTDYMVATMQSEDAIRADIDVKGYLYYLLENSEGTCVGYTALLPEHATGHEDEAWTIAHGDQINQHHLERLFISKIYLYKEQRGKHYASRVLEFCEQLCAEQGLTGEYLTVNRGNTLGIRAYLGNGFEIIQEYAGEIGNGFVMDDYIMMKTL